MKKAVIFLIMLLLLVGCGKEKNEFQWFGYSEEDKKEIVSVVEAIEQINSYDDYCNYFRRDGSESIKTEVITISDEEWYFYFYETPNYYGLWADREIGEFDVKYIDFVAECLREYHNTEFLYVDVNGNPTYFAKIKDRCCCVELVDKQLYIKNEPVDMYDYLLEYK